MIAFDANVLYAALVRTEETSEKALAIIQELSGRDDVVIAEQTLIETYGLLRNPIITKPPMTGPEAVGTLDRIRANPHWKVDTFYTRNVRDFGGVGFKRLVNPFE